MQWRDRLIWILCFISATGFFWASSSQLDSINSSREEMGLVSNPALENAPPSLAFATVAMGAFRGLIVDILWLRADRLKQEGQFFDARQLAEWITILQPRFANVWDFHAWNMAYNISVAIPESQWQDRWRWVQNGYELLRDKGIETNPHAIMLYRSLAMIFQHKIGGSNDTCHTHYKRELATEMRALVDPRTNEHFQALADAPETFSQIIADPEVAKFVTALQETDEVFADQERFVGNYLALRRRPDSFDPAVFDAIDRFRETEALEAFDTFAKAYQLRNVWKLELDLLLEINAKHGPIISGDPNDRDPLDWGHPDTHAIYWAELGLRRAGNPERYSTDEKNTDRIVFHSLQSLYRRGNLIFYPVPDQLPSVFLRPDLRMFEVCDKAWLGTIEKYETMEDGTAMGLHTGHRNFLINAVASFYQAGQIAKAGKIYSQIRKLYPREDTTVSLLEFVRNRIADELELLGGKDAAEFILFTLREAYFRYTVHQDKEAFGREKLCMEAYELFRQQWGDDGFDREIPPFEVLRYLALLGFINDEFYPEYLRQSLMSRIRIERPELFEKLAQQEGSLMQMMEQYQNQQQ